MRKVTESFGLLLMLTCLSVPLVRRLGIRLAISLMPALWQLSKSLMRFLTGRCMVWAGNFSWRCCRVKLTRRKFGKIFKAVVDWLAFVYVRSHQRGPDYWYPGALTGVDDKAKQTAERVARLFMDYTRMDLEDGDADALRRLESWLSSEIQRIRVTQEG